MAQHSKDANNTHVIYLEVAGVGGYGSVNYAYTYSLKEKLKVGGRFGFSTYRLWGTNQKFNPDILIPSTIHVLFGTKHHFIMGAGITYSNLVSFEPETIQNKRVIQSSGHVEAGYRYQNKHKRLVLGTTLSILNIFKDDQRNWIGITLGWRI